MGATWDEHRQQVERHRALVTRAGHGVNQTPGNVDDLFSRRLLGYATSAHPDAEL